MQEREVRMGFHPALQWDRARMARNAPLLGEALDDPVLLQWAGARMARNARSIAHQKARGLCFNGTGHEWPGMRRIGLGDDTDRAELQWDRARMARNASSRAERSARSKGFNGTGHEWPGMHIQ